MTILSAMTGLAKFAGAVVVGIAVCWEAVDQAGPEYSEVVIHVNECDVHISVDDLDFRVDSVADWPVVCNVRPGRHLLRMTRSGEILYEEDFAIRRGEDKILTACRPRPTAMPELDQAPACWEDTLDLLFLPLADPRAFPRPRDFTPSPTGR